jgi:hypothetical protein
MKKLILILFLFPSIAFCQNNDTTRYNTIHIKKTSPPHDTLVPDNTKYNRLSDANAPRITILIGGKNSRNVTLNELQTLSEVQVEDYPIIDTEKYVVVSFGLGFSHNTNIIAKTARGKPYTVWERTWLLTKGHTLTGEMKTKLASLIIGDHIQVGEVIYREKGKRKKLTAVGMASLNIIQ